MLDERKDRIVDRILRYIDESREQIRKVSDLASMMYIDADYPYREITEKTLRQSEKLHLGYIEIAQQILGADPPNLARKYGIKADFESEITNLGEGKWKLHLPPFAPVSRRNREGNEGKLAYYHVLNLLDNYAEEHPGEISPVHKPLIVIEYHMPRGRRTVFDFDNVDSKRVIDAMQGYFFNDDGAFDIRLMHITAEDSESFTDIYILPSGEGGFDSKNIV